MSSYLKEKLNNWEAKRSIKNYLKPDKNFLKQSKVLFLNKLKEKSVTENLAHRNIYIKLVPKYVLVAITIIFIFGSSLVVFAEKQNVSATSPLYNLKKIGEKVQLSVTPEAKKPEVHNELAKRRLEEIKQLQVESEQIINELEAEKSKKYEKAQEKIEKLNKEFHYEVQAAIQDIQIPENENMATSSQSQNEIIEPTSETDNKRKKELCENIAEKVRDHKEILPDEEGENKEWLKFYEKCSAYIIIDSQKENKQEEIKSEQQKIETPKKNERYEKSGRIGDD